MHQIDLAEVGVRRCNEKAIKAGVAHIIVEHRIFMEIIEDLLDEMIQRQEDTDGNNT